MAKAGKDGKGIGRSKKIDDKKQTKLTVEVGRKVTSAKELGVGVIEVKELIEEVRNNLFKKIKKLKEEWREKIKRLKERIDEIGKELSKL